MNKKRNIKYYIVVLVIGILIASTYQLPIFAIAINRSLSINDSFLLLQAQFPEVIDTLRCYSIIGSAAIGYSLGSIFFEKNAEDLNKNFVKKGYLFYGKR